MNTHKNNRYLETENRIENAFIKTIQEKEINNISVSDICKCSHLSRTTFYAHYEDINDLIYKIETAKSKKIKELLILSDNNIHEKFVKYFNFLKQNKEFYNAYFSIESNSSIVHELMYSYQKNLTKNNYNPATINYYMNFFKAGIKETAKQWLKNDCKESSVYMADLLTDGLINFINRSAI